MWRGMQVSERLWLLDVAGLAQPYICLAAAAGDWGKAIEKLLVNGSRWMLAPACPGCYSSKEGLCCDVARV